MNAVPIESKVRPRLTEHPNALPASELATVRAAENIVGAGNRGEILEVQCPLGVSGRLRNIKMDLNF